MPESKVSEPLLLSTDVLVIGGGPAATWAALSAREAGADVVLVGEALVTGDPINNLRAFLAV